MIELKKIYEPMKTGFLFIDSYEEKQLKGRLWYKHMGEEKHFSNLMQFVFLINDVLSQLDYPNEYLTMKTFAPVSKKGEAQFDEQRERAAPAEGALASFKLKIVFRQNASWQGTLAWVEGKQELSFRSMLELLLMLDSALTQTKN